MERNKFIEKIHFYNHNIENDLENIISKDCILEIKIENNDIKQAMLDMHQKVNNNLKKFSEFEVSYLDLVLLFSNKKSIIKDYEQKDILTLSYNDLYDIAMKNETLEDIYFLRIETEDNKGLYSAMSDNGTSIHDKFDYCSNRQPSPMEDSFLKSIFGNYKINRKNEEHWHFGFLDKDSLNSWLNNKDLLNYIIESIPDIKVSCYKINEKDIIKTNIQLVYKKGKEKLINQTLLSDFNISSKNEIEDFLQFKIASENKLGKKTFKRPNIS